MSKSKELEDNRAARTEENWEGYEIETIRELFSDIDDPRVHTIILARAEGLTWKASAARAKVTAATAFALRHSHPIDARAAALALEAVTAGALTMFRAYGSAAAYLVAVMNDESARPGDRITAAKTILGEVRGAAGFMRASTTADHRQASEEPPEAVEVTHDVHTDGSPVSSVASRIRARRALANG